MKTSPSLLEQITARTPSGPNRAPMIRITDSRQLLKLARPYQPVNDPPADSDQDLYFDHLFRELLREIGFSHDQYLACRDQSGAEERLAFFRQRLEVHLQAFCEAASKLQPHLQAALKRATKAETPLLLRVFHCVRQFTDNPETGLWAIFSEVTPEESSPGSRTPSASLSGTPSANTGNLPVKREP